MPPERLQIEMRMPDPHGTTSTIGCSKTFLVKEKTGMKKNFVTADEPAAKQLTGNTVGLDLGDRWSRYCVLDQAGTIVKEDRVRTTLDALKEELGGMPR